MFSQENGIIQLVVSGYDSNAAVEFESFQMKGYDECCIAIMFSDSLTGDNVLTVECGATDSADTSDMTFHYRLGSAVNQLTSADVYAADATASTLSLVAATYQGKTLLIEFNAEDLPTSGTTVYDWVTVDLDGAATGTSLISAVAILSKPRIAKAVMPTAIS
jgi:hypothetical protein